MAVPNDDSKKRRIGVELDEEKLEKMMDKVMSQMITNHVQPVMDRISKQATDATIAATAANQGLHELSAELGDVKVQLREVVEKTAKLEEQAAEQRSPRAVSQPSFASGPPVLVPQPNRVDARSNASTASAGSWRDKFARMVVGGFPNHVRKAQITTFLQNQVDSLALSDHVDRITCFEKRCGPGFINFKASLARDDFWRLLKHLKTEALFGQGVRLWATPDKSQAEREKASAISKSLKALKRILSEIGSFGDEQLQQRLEIDWWAGEIWWDDVLLAISG